MPHTHKHDTRYKASRVEDIQTGTEINVEIQETQLTSEMEVATNSNVETRPEGTPHAEPEVEVRVDNQPRQPERPAQSGDISLQEIMRAITENNNSINKNMESLNKNVESLKEDLHTKLDDNNRNMESLRAGLNLSLIHI